MTISTITEYNTALTLANSADFVMVSAGAAGKISDFTRNLGSSPTTPTTSTTYTKDSDRAINGLVANGGAGRLSILGGTFSGGTQNNWGLLLVDMLNLSGGMSGIVTGPQSTNLPTAALTRYTDGAGVMAAIMIHTAIGATATTCTVTYTNQSGTGSRTSPAFQIGGTGFATAGFLLKIPLQAGDTGVRSVESINIVATTGTAGNIGIVLYKPLAMFVATDAETSNFNDCISTGKMVGQFNEVLDDACLSIFGSMNVGQQISGSILLGEA